MFNRIKGTRDYSHKQAITTETIRSIFIKSSQNFNFNYVETPIIEPAQLFKRSVAGSDIVKKEMYEFKDKGDREVVLRPEGTAGFVRAFIENKWYSTEAVQKFSYFGPMFRYEQPQKGRYRQFYQAGAEYIGEANPYIEAELISFAQQILGIMGINTVLKINSIGDQEARDKYQNELKKYFAKYKNDLSQDSQQRLESNVLRILDDKEDSKKDFVKKAPKINNFLNQNSNKYFYDLLSILDYLEIKYQIDYSLVRGLDYYDEIVYEFVSTSKNKGSQSTIIGGGRYSNLISDLGGPKLAASGWGFGVDRAADILFEDDLVPDNSELEKVHITIGSTNKESMDFLLLISNKFRSLDVNVEFIKDVSKSKKIFERAKKLDSDFLIMNDTVNNNPRFLAKNLKTNDKIYFTDSEDGLVDLFQFLEDNELRQFQELDDYLE